MWSHSGPATIRNDRLDVPFSHRFVARGTVDLESAGALNEGDAVRLTASAARSSPPWTTPRC
jgi:hypothetical protein